MAIDIDDSTTHAPTRKEQRETDSQGMKKHHDEDKHHHPHKHKSHHHHPTLHNKLKKGKHGKKGKKDKKDDEDGKDKTKEQEDEENMGSMIEDLSVAEVLARLKTSEEAGLQSVCIAHSQVPPNMPNIPHRVRHKRGYKSMERMY